MGDIIKELPVDTLPPTNDEKEMINWMYNDENKKKENIEKPKANIQLPERPNKKLQLEIKSLIIIIILYILLSNKYIDSVFFKILPITSKSDLILLFTKSFIFTIILFIFLNLYYK